MKTADIKTPLFAKEMFINFFLFTDAFHQKFNESEVTFDSRAMKHIQQASDRLKSRAKTQKKGNFQWIWTPPIDINFFPLLCLTFFEKKSTNFV